MRLTLAISAIRRRPTRFAPVEGVRRQTPCTCRACSVSSSGLRLRGPYPCPRGAASATLETGCRQARSPAGTGGCSLPRYGSSGKLALATARSIAGCREAVTAARTSPVARLPVLQASVRRRGQPPQRPRRRRWVPLPKQSEHFGKRAGQYCDKAEHQQHSSRSGRSASRTRGRAPGRSRGSARPAASGKRGPAAARRRRRRRAPSRRGRTK